MDQFEEREQMKVGVLFVLDWVHNRPDQSRQGVGGCRISVLTYEADPQLREEYAAAGADRLIIMLYSHPGTAVPREDAWQVGAAAATSPAPAPGETLRALELIGSRACL